MSDIPHSSAEFSFHWSPGIAKQLIEHVLQRNMRPQAITAEQLQFLDGAPLTELGKILQGLQSRYGLRKVGEAGEVMDVYSLVFVDESRRLCLFEFDGMHGATIGPVPDGESSLYVHDHPNIRKSPGALHVLSLVKTVPPEVRLEPQLAQEQKTYWGKIRSLLPSWLKFGE